MANSKNPSLILLLSLLTLSAIINSSRAEGEGIAVYWGQDAREGTLTDTCASQNYKYVILSFLNVFGCGRTPSWNFAGHCGDWSPCTKLESEIKYCQSQNIRVLLSIGGADGYGPYSLCSKEEAKQFANYLWDNFLTGRYGPLGSVTLDGIDFNIEGYSNLYYEDLATELHALSAQRKIYLTAAPQCPIPDHYLDTALKTGLFDYIWVQFYNNAPCQYSNGNTELLFNSWATWTNSFPNSLIFLGLPANPQTASGGYIPPDVLISDVLPHVKQASNYGGVMLWSRYWDTLTSPSYSDLIKDSVPKSASLKSITQIRDAIFECVSATLNQLLPKSAVNIVLPRLAA